MTNPRAFRLHQGQYMLLGWSGPFAGVIQEKMKIQSASGSAGLASTDTEGRLYSLHYIILCKGLQHP